MSESMEPRGRRQWVSADVVDAKENAAYNAGYADGRTDGWILSDPWSHEDWQLVVRVAAELCRQRGLVWAEQGNDVRVALTGAAARIIGVALNGYSPPEGDQARPASPIWLRNQMGDVRGMQTDGATPEEMDEALGRALRGERARLAFDQSREVR